MQKITCASCRCRYCCVKQFLSRCCDIAVASTRSKEMIAPHAVVVYLIVVHFLVQYSLNRDAAFICSKQAGDCKNSQRPRLRPRSTAAPNTFPKCCSGFAPSVCCLFQLLQPLCCSCRLSFPLYLTGLYASTPCRVLRLPSLLCIHLSSSCQCAAPGSICLASRDLSQVLARFGERSSVSCAACRDSVRSLLGPVIARIPPCGMLHATVYSYLLVARAITSRLACAVMCFCSRLVSAVNSGCGSGVPRVLCVPPCR